MAYLVCAMLCVIGSNARVPPYQHTCPLLCGREPHSCLAHHVQADAGFDTATWVTMHYQKEAAIKVFYAFMPFVFLHCEPPHWMQL